MRDVHHRSRGGEMTASTDVRPERAGRDRGGLRVAVQKLGTALSNMVLPNIGAFIAWGLITALFIEAGWITLVGDSFVGRAPADGYGFVENFGGWGAGEGGGVVGPTSAYLRPVVIGYAGCRMMCDDGIRGGGVCAIATKGAATGAAGPMFLGATVRRPPAEWSMKKLAALWSGGIRPGIE